MTPNPYKPTITRVKRVERFEPLGCLEFIIAPTSGLFFLAGLVRIGYYFGSPAFRAVGWLPLLLLSFFSLNHCDSLSSCLAHFYLK